MRTVLSGDDLGINIAGISLLNWAEVADNAKLSGGIIEHIINPHFWDANEVIVELYNEDKGRTYKYTAGMLNQLFRDINSTVSFVI